MDKEARSYLDVKAAFREEFRAKQDHQKAIGDVFLLKTHKKQSVYDFALKAEEAYKLAGFRMERSLFLFQKL